MGLVSSDSECTRKNESLGPKLHPHFRAIAAGMISLCHAYQFRYGECIIFEANEHLSLSVIPFLPRSNASFKVKKSTGSHCLPTTSFPLGTGESVGETWAFVPTDARRDGTFEGLVGEEGLQQA